MTTRRVYTKSSRFYSNMIKIDDLVWSFRSQTRPMTTRLWYRRSTRPEDQQFLDAWRSRKASTACRRKAKARPFPKPFHSEKMLDSFCSRIFEVVFAVRLVLGSKALKYYIWTGLIKIMEDSKDSLTLSYDIALD